MSSLVIYIPTWNRPNELKVQLTALGNQVKHFKGRVTVIVSDNNSTDKASREVQSWVETLDWAILRRRPANIGGNANILCGFLEGHPDSYIWVLADDTTVDEGAINNLFSLMGSGSDIIALYDDDQLSFPKHLEFSATNFQFALKFNWGLISSVIYRFDFISEDLNQGFRYHNSSFPHLGILFSSWKRHGRINIEWARTADLHQGNQGQLKSDYSLALVGYPQLFIHLNRRDRKALLLSWLRRYSAGLAHYRRREELSASTTLWLVRQSGLGSRFWRSVGEIENSLRESRLGIQAQQFLIRHPRLLERLMPRKRMAYLVSARDESNESNS